MPTKNHKDKTFQDEYLNSEKIGIDIQIQFGKEGGMEFGKSLLVRVLVMALVAVVGTQALRCYAGNENDGNVAPRRCQQGYDYCVYYYSYPSENYTGNVYYFCDDGLWCGEVINQTGSEYNCCQTDLCNDFTLPVSSDTPELIAEQPAFIPPKFARDRRH